MTIYVCILIFSLFLVYIFCRTHGYRDNQHTLHHRYKQSNAQCWKHQQQRKWFVLKLAMRYSENKANLNFNVCLDVVAMSDITYSDLSSNDATVKASQLKKALRSNKFRSHQAGSLDLFNATRTLKLEILSSQSRIYVNVDGTMVTYYCFFYLTRLLIAYHNAAGVRRFGWD